MASGFCAIPARQFLFYCYRIIQRTPIILHKKSPPGCMVLQTPEGFFMLCILLYVSLYSCHRLRALRISHLLFIALPSRGFTSFGQADIAIEAGDSPASVNLFSGRNRFCLTPCRIVFLSTCCPVCADPHVVSLSRT